MQRARPRGGLGAVRQPQLRGPDQPRRQDELPGVAAAGGGVRAGRHDGPRPHHRAARHRHRRQAGLPARHLADARTRSRRSSTRAIASEMFTTRLRRRVRRRRALAGACRPRPATRSSGTPTRPTCASPRTSRAWPREPDAGHGHHRRPGAGQARRLGHHRPHLAGRRDQGRLARPGRYLAEHGVERRDFNSYGSRRGNHEVMIRGTFANIRLRNQLVPGTEGGFTDQPPDRRARRRSTTRRAAYQAAGVPLVILAGKEYGSGSSRDWAAKGTALLGVRAVIAESYERIHRSNLIGMGVLPLQFPAGETAESLGPDRRGDVRRSPASRRSTTARPRATVTVRAGHTASRSTRSCASTPPARRTTTATAASCSTCCARCWRADRSDHLEGPPGPQGALRCARLDAWTTRPC